MSIKSFHSPPFRVPGVSRPPAAGRPLPFSPLLVLAMFLAMVLAPTCAHAQVPQINEFLAVNTKGIQDNDGSYQGWVEVYNPNLANPVNLNGYKLTDGTNVWTFPSVQVMPDDRLLVWASGKDKREPTAPLHTNFTIPAAGGTLSLQNSTGTVISSFISYPAQTADVSWGRDLSDVNLTSSAATATVGPRTQTGFYTEPTPGEANNFVGAGVAGEVEFSVPSRAFLSTETFPLTISLKIPDPDAVIRYTLSTTNSTANNSLPNATTGNYAEPLTINSTCLVRARVFKEGKLPGATTTAGYLRLAANAENFSSTMPIVVFSNFSGSTPPGDGDQASYMWVWEPAAPDNLSRFSNPPTQFNRTMIDRRGSSTLDNPKFSLNVETRRQDNDEEEDISLLGMPEHSDWVFHAPYNFDRSLLHNPLVAALSNQIGRYAVRNRMAEVFCDTNGSTLTFNNSASGDYFGVYNVFEKIRRGKDRVDIKKLEMYDNDAVNKTGGYIWKVDRVDTGDSGFSAGGQSFAYYYPKERDLEAPQRAPQRTYLSSYITSFNTALQGANYTNPDTGYAAFMDVPAAIDHHLINTWANNVDGLRLSGYWTKDREAKMYPGPIWDFDRALSSTDGRDINPKLWSGSGDATDFFNYTWWNRLFRDANFYQAYIDRWQTLRRTGAFSPASIDALIDDLNSQISAEAIARDVKRWNQTKRNWTGAYALHPVLQAGQPAEVQRLKDYLQVRADFFDTQWVAPPDTTANSGYIVPGSQVTLTGPAAGKIYYTTDGSDPRPFGGAAPAAGTVEYTGPITVTGNLRLKARVYNSAFTALTGSRNPPVVNKWSGPLDRTYTIDPPAAAGELVISEINYHPADPTPAELAVDAGFVDNDFEFIEIRNVSDHTVNLNEAAFTAGVSYTFTGAGARSLAPGGILVIADNLAAFAARYGAAVTPVGPYSGDLSNGSETVTLTSALGTVLDSVTYSDKWFPTTDGGGFSLVVKNVFPDDADKAAAWQASAVASGSPGAWDSASLVFTAGPDRDTSGSTALAGLPLVDLSAGAPVWAWSTTSGPGVVTYADADAQSTTATFPVPGLYVIRLSLTFNAITTFDELRVSMQDTPAAWIARNPGLGTLTDDFDKDGRINFAEFALNTDATVSDGSEPPVLSVENGKSVLTYLRRKPASGVIYGIEISNGLDAWRVPSSGELTELIIADDGLLETVKVTDTVSRATEPRRFLRLRMSTAP